MRDIKEEMKKLRNQRFHAEMEIKDLERIERYDKIIDLFHSHDLSLTVRPSISFDRTLYGYNRANNSIEEISDVNGIKAVEELFAQHVGWGAIIEYAEKKGNKTK